jgi:hypothetical protein
MTGWGVGCMQWFPGTMSALWLLAMRVDSAHELRILKCSVVGPEAREALIFEPSARGSQPHLVVSFTEDAPLMERVGRVRSVEQGACE